jgi:GNAT superfamily N-acetyltransferase
MIFEEVKMTPDIKIRTLTGAAIKTYIPSIVKVRGEVLKEYPYMRAGHAEEDTQYFKRLAQSKDSIAVLVFDGHKIIGVSTGMPLDEQIPHLQKTFLENDLQPSDYYYFGVCALLKPYRGRGIAHHFFDLREEHAKHLKRFNKICLSSVLRPKNHQKKPKDYISLDSFWKKRGYVERKDLMGQLSWREHDEKGPSPKPLVFWVKEI